MGQHVKKVVAREDGSDVALREMPALTPAQLGRAKRRPGVGYRGKGLPLAALRAARGLTQAEVARASGLTQGEISRLERRLDLDGVRVGTLRRYIEALGGQLDLVGVGIMSDRHLRIAGGAFAVDERGRKRKVGLGEPSS
jgi:hypothetical protein